MSDVVLGVHCSIQPDQTFAAEGNVAVLVDGQPAFAIAEERVTRRKYDGGFAAGLHYTLDAMDLQPGDIHSVAISTFGRPDQPEGSELQAVERVVRDAIGDGPSYSVIPSHHLVHALSAVAQSSLDRCLVAVIDNEGSILGRRRYRELWRNHLERTSYYLLEGDRLELIARDHCGAGEVGYGKVYSKVTRYCGFRSYHESGKTMALAAFGDRERFGQVPMFVPDGGGQPRTLLRNSPDGLNDLASFFHRSGEGLPPARQPGEALVQAHTDLAAWCQAGLQESVSERIAGLAAEHSVSAVCGAGGVFLNSVMNRCIQEVLDTPDVSIPPSPGDAGLALGAAVWSAWMSSGKLPRFEATPYLGRVFSNREIEAELRDRSGLSWRHVHDPVALATEDLVSGHVVGWFRGRSEHGPRALGNRSILADPSNPWVRELLNNRVKAREWFRPYAPVVAEDRAKEIFDARSTVPHMMHVAPVHRGYERVIPGGVHVDRSARLQTVRTEQNPDFYRLLTDFEGRSGVPAVLNTSLNVDGMPIVETPADALDCFGRAPAMDVIYMESIRVTRSRASS